MTALCLPGETWKPVPDFPGYEVSNHGRVRSYHRRSPGGHNTAWILSDRPQRIVRGCNMHGYRSLVLCSNGHRQRFLVHRLVLSAFVCPCPEGLETCHNDGDRSNNHLSNLRYDTPSSNVQDTFKHGTWRPGGTRLFTEEQIVQIRTERASGATFQALSERWGITRTPLFRICVGMNYKDCLGPISPREEHNRRRTCTAAKLVDEPEPYRTKETV